MRHSDLIRKLFMFSFLLGLTVTDAFSYFKVDGIWYDFYYNNGAPVGDSLRVMPHIDLDRNTLIRDYEGDIVIPEKVTYEGKDYTVNKIDIQAFYLCDKVTSIALPSSIKVIDDYAFQSTGISSIKLSEGLQFIGDCAFAYTGISTINLPQGLRFIGNAAFAETKISELKIPASCRYFYIHPTLYPDNPERSLISSSFQLMYDLRKIEIETGHPVYTSVDGVVYSVDKSTLVFLPPKNSENFVIPPTVSALDNGCFTNCSQKKMSIPASVNQITPMSFSNSNFEEIEFEKSDMPLKIIRKFWLSFSNNLGYWKTLRKVILNRPFSDQLFDDLTYSSYEEPYKYKITLEINSDHPSFQQKMDGFNSFEVLRQLSDISKEITIQNSAKYLWYKDALYTDIGDVLGNGRNYYSLLTFPGMMENNYLQIHPDCTVIPGEMFKNSRLKRVDLYNLISGLNKNLFKNSAIEEIRLGNNIGRIEESAFENCENLRELQIPESVRKIGAYAFKNTGIQSIRFGANIDSVGSYVCSNCPNLVEAVIESGTIKTSNNIEINSIPTCAFKECSSLKKVTISERINHVQSGAFSNSMIDNGEIFMRNSTPLTYQNKYMGIPTARAQTITMYVPKGSGEAYRAYTGNVSSAGVGFKIEEFDYAGIGETSAKETLQINVIPGGVEITGTGNGNLRIYNIGGALVYSGAEGRIPLNPGMHIIRVNNQIHKVFVR